ncbi:WhiB family transcriptional regulator [Rhodococcus sp. As11]|uniref:WhiB family transcriptional regulator n=1 Tax=Rhodococcus sp. As11 TaxID=3029189 RepID=UPI003B7A285E
MASSRRPPRFRPIVDGWQWQLRALCRFTDPTVFFAQEQESQGVRVRRERIATGICARCPVRPECRAFARIHKERWGVWGGTTESERRAW